MPLSKDDRAFLKKINDTLLGDPLDPKQPFYQERYEPIYEHDPDDAVSRMLSQIELTDLQSVQLFSGFSGSGKTTELFRLRAQLEENGYAVLYADAQDYLNPAEPIEISELLIVLAGAFGEALETQFGKEIIRETFWERFAKFLTTEIEVKEAGVSADLTSPVQRILGGLKAGVNLKFAIKSDPGFRDRLRLVLSSRLRELKKEVNKFIENGINEIRAQKGQDVRVVFLFDQLEKIHGTYQSERDVIASVEKIFSSNIDMLRIPYVHLVYTVPPWLKFLLKQQSVPIIMLSTRHLWKNDGPRSRSEEDWTSFRSLVHRRLGDEGLRRLFAIEPGHNAPLLDEIIEACGGHFRDLLRLLRECLLRAFKLPALPLTAQVVGAAVNAVRRDLLPLSVEDAKWLAEIDRDHKSALPASEPEPANRLARFLNNHLVLYFCNGTEWYDVHPLIRGEIHDVLASAAKAGAGNGP